MVFSLYPRSSPSSVPRNGILLRLRISIGSAELVNLLQNYRDELVDGRRLETLLLSPAVKAHVIVMLHDGLGSIAMWKDFHEQLAHATGCGLLLHSLYGPGKSGLLAVIR